MQAAAADQATDLPIQDLDGSHALGGPSHGEELSRAVQQAQRTLSSSIAAEGSLLALRGKRQHQCVHSPTDVEASLDAVAESARLALGRASDAAFALQEPPSAGSPHRAGVGTPALAGLAAAVGVPLDGCEGVERQGLAEDAVLRSRRLVDEVAQVLARPVYPKGR